MKRIFENKNNRKPLLLFILAIVLFLIVGFLFFLIGKKFLPVTTAVYDTAKDNFKYTIIIDAGHGGLDSGASNNGIYEKDLALSISQKISAFLEMYNVEVKMTRSDDNLLADKTSKNKKRDDLFNRYKFASSFDNQIFLSIHINKFSESKYKGLQVFYSDNNSYSESLALILQSNTKDLLQKDNNREIKNGTSSIYLLDRLRCPAVLVECGFISNPDEFRLLTDDIYQNRLAFVIANSIIEFINI